VGVIAPVIFDVHVNVIAHVIVDVDVDVIVDVDVDVDVNAVQFAGAMSPYKIPRPFVPTYTRP